MKKSGNAKISALEGRIRRSKMPNLGSLRARLGRGTGGIAGGIKPKGKANTPSVMTKGPSESYAKKG